MTERTCSCPDLHDTIALSMPLLLSSFDWFFQWMQAPTWKLVFLLFVNGLWIPFFYIFLQEVWEAFQFWTADFYSAQHRKFIFLAIDVPGLTEATPASMEAIFNQLAGAHGSTNKYESIWLGEFQEWFSFEIVSIDGYVQYLIRTHVLFRDLVEAAIYAQYPDAEISEVKDYTTTVPSVYPDKEWKFFGTEYIAARPDAYPIKTYVEFEDKVRGEYVDPMAGLLEIMGKIGKGEQIWYQVLFKPIVGSDWIPEAEKELNKLIDREDPETKRTGLSRILDIPHFLTNVVDSFAGTGFISPADDSDKGSENDIARSPMFSLTPGQRTLLEDMERKTGKLAYKCLIRIAYYGKRNIYNKARGVGPVIGALKQFNDDSRNWFKVGKKTWIKTQYFFKRAREYQRMNNFYKSYSGRSLTAAEATKGYVLTSEELATIYHFPVANVKAPLVKRTGARKSEPPTTLPTGDIGGGKTVRISVGPEPPGFASAQVDVEEKKANKPSALEKMSASAGIEVPKQSEPEAIPIDKDVKIIQIPDAPPEPRSKLQDMVGDEDAPSNLPTG